MKKLETEAAKEISGQQIKKETTLDTSQVNKGCLI